MRTVTEGELFGSRPSRDRLLRKQRAHLVGDRARCKPWIQTIEFVNQRSVFPNKDLVRVAFDSAHNISAAFPGVSAFMPRPPSVLIGAPQNRAHSIWELSHSATHFSSFKCRLRT